MSAPSPEELLHASFAGLDPLTRDEVALYLLGGRNHRFPARLKPAVAAAIAAIPHEARAQFYLAMDRADDQLLVRLGRLLSAAGAVRFSFPPEHVPRSIWVLLDDAHRAVFSAGGQAPAFSTMTAGRVQRLLELEGVRPDASARLVIDMLVGSSTGSPEYAPRGLQTIPGTAELLAQNRDVLYERVSSYRDGGHIEVIRQAAAHPVLAARIAELLAAYAVWSDKAIRTSALAVFGTLPVDIQALLLESKLAATGGAERSRVITAVERIPDTAVAVGLLERALAGAKGAIADELDRAIQRLAIFDLAGAPIEAPQTPLVPLAEHRIDERTAESIRTALTEFAERRRRTLPALERAREEFVREHPGGCPGNELEHVLGLIDRADATIAALPAVTAYLSGEAPHPGEPLVSLLLWQGVRERVVGFEPVNWARASARPGLSRVHHSAVVGQDGVTDARAIADVLIRSGCSPEEAHSAIIDSYFAEPWSVPTLTPAQLAPYLVDNPRVFDVVLGLANGVPPRAYGDFTDAVLAILEASPSIAARYLPVVTALAIGSAKTHRRAAQRVLETHGLARRLAEEALRGSGVQERTAAVLWLESLGGDDTVALLGEHLGREQATAVRATIIAALERLGRDIREYLRPEVLEAEAAKAEGLPAGLRWFPFAELPECRYADGSAVPALVIRSWVTLAFSLKDPEGAGLVPLYLRTLDERDAEALGRFVLMTWLARDSAPLDDETVMRRSMAAVERYEASIAELVRWIPDLEVTVGQTLDFFDAEREKLQATTPSAIGGKGLLALATRMEGAELAEIVRQFMRRQHLKRAQIDALLHVIAQSGHPEPLHLLVATARRHRTAGLQETARMLVEQVAARRGWTADELADRMIPTAGFDDSRSVGFDYGPRQFVGRLGTALVIELVDDDGLPVRALPSPRVSDTEATAAKAAFTAAKKELAAVVKLQRRRLYDAMCLRREWTAADWRELIVGHPIAGLLAAGLVWHLGDAVGRPDPDGRVLDVEGAALEVPDSAVVRVAHSTTLRADLIAGWRARPSTVALGFDQFRAGPVAVAGAESQRDDLEGAESESFTLRSRLTKLEWTRGETGDDVRFDEYVKSFGPTGPVGVISFSGSSLPEASIPVELGVLTMRRAGAPVRFADVPPALLAELVADYCSLG